MKLFSQIQNKFKNVKKTIQKNTKKKDKSVKI